MKRSDAVYVKHGIFFNMQYYNGVLIDELGD